jgi:tRNA threonylcarbamoyl adenosine modification protein YeaZ
VPARPLLAVDTASPVVSVAAARGDRILAARGGAQRESSALLIGWIDEVLGEAGVALGDLAGAVALRGPGSFTGLRVGLATLLGFHQAIGLSVTGLPTLAVLAAAAPAGRRVLALVPAGPGEWFAQAYESDWPPRPLADPLRLPVGEIADAAADAELLVVATPAEAERLGEGPLPPLHVAGALAPVAARLASLHPPAWDAALLSAPLYLAPAPVTVPGVPKPVLPRSPAPVADRRRRRR